MFDPKSSGNRFPSFHEIDQNEFDQPTSFLDEETDPPSCPGESDYYQSYLSADEADDDDWRVEDFSQEDFLQGFSLAESPTTPTRLNTGRLHPFERPQDVLRLIRREQDYLADCCANISHESNGKPREQILILRTQIERSRQRLEDLTMRLDIAREINGLRHYCGKTIKGR
jgi:hypothetical protein